MKESFRRTADIFHRFWSNSTSLGRSFPGYTSDATELKHEQDDVISKVNSILVVPNCFTNRASIDYNDEAIASQLIGRS